MFTSNPPDDLEQYINMEEGLARIRGNKIVYKAMLSAFQKDRSIQQLEDALQQSDLKAAEMAAHTLKGVAGNLSFTALYKLAADLNLLLTQGKRSEEIETATLQAAAKTMEYVQWMLQSM